jgi:transcriptional regulator with XRE-family HTH domain
LPTGSHRRAVGLRREEVAVLAGVSPAWYTFLEQGRDINPSAEVLDSLAGVLSLTEDERRYMHVLANRTAEVRPLAGDVSAEESVRLLVQTAENISYPVYGVDVYCDVLAWNNATTSYYTDFGTLPAERRNMLRWLLMAPEARERLPEWAEETRDVVARWRAMLATHERDGRADKLIAEFQDLSTDFCNWWDTFDVQEHRSRPRRFQHPVHGDQSLRLIVVQAPDFAPSVVVFHVPA